MTNEIKLNGPLNLERKDRRMSDKSKIEWTDATWNPVTGCTKVSEGCRNCYAKTFAERFEGTPGHYFENGFAVTLRPNKLLEPIKWSKAKKIFVNSMSDVFHEDVPDWYIDQIFGVILANHVLDRQAEHSFQLLTKRPFRMKEYLSADRDDLIKRWSESLDGVVIMDDPDIYFSEYVSGFLDRDGFFPLPNVWLGVSVENQKAADERIPLLLQTPAAIRFLSCEPLLGEVRILHELMGGRHPGKCGNCGKDHGFDRCPNYGGISKTDKEYGCEEFKRVDFAVDWVIAGGESGPGARPMHPDWVRSLRDQCQRAAVPFFFKQWGEWTPIHDLRANEPGIKGKIWHTFDPDNSVCKIGKTAAGRLLDGRTWDEMPLEERDEIDGKQTIWSY
jgi:protein gp37